MARWKTLAGMKIRDTRTEAVLDLIDRRRRGGVPLAIGFVNQHFVVACRALKTAAGADPTGLLLLNDGIAVSLAARFFAGGPFRENLNGTDLVPRLLRDVRRPLDIFLLGGRPDVVIQAAALIDALPRRRIVGAVDGFSVWAREEEVIRAINAARPDLLLVGFGNPKQESWILEHRRNLEVDTIFAVGALFEWMTGTRRRAPLLVRRAKLEWLYRLALEPRRLMKRYTLDGLRFLALVWRERGQ